MFPPLPVRTRSFALALCAAVVATVIVGVPAPARAVAPDIVVLGGPGAVSDTLVDELEACTTGAVTRIWGADRNTTAAEISAHAFDATPVVYLATGDDFPDALAGGPAAVADGAPILLVQRESVPAATRTELARLAPKEVVILGGEGVVSTAVETDLAANHSVTRVSGTDRYTTAAAISMRGFPDGADVAYVAAGDNFPDALAGGAAAAALGAPVLLVARDAVPGAISAELKRLAPDEIIVLGGTGAVSDATLQSLGTIAPARRIAGPDRYATAAAISADAFVEAGTVYVATGEDFPDALAGVALAGSHQAPILLTGSDFLPSSIRAEIERFTGVECEPTQVIIPADGEVGFLGCSNSVRAVRGVPDNGVTGLFWPTPGVEHPYGGGDLERWSNPDDVRWDAFQEYLDAEGIPDRIWWQLCPKHVGGQPEPTADEIAQTAVTLAEMQRRAPGAEIFVSALNGYDGVTCGRVGTNGVEAMEVLADMLAGEPGVSRGPTLTPLTPETVIDDDCHQNEEGGKIHGADLIAFFD